MILRSITAYCRIVHVNDDKLLDLIVVNDSTPNQLYLNKGDGTFEEVGYPSGVALNENGREQAGWFGCGRLRQ